MKKICVMLLVAVLSVATTVTGGMGQQTSFAPATDFPYETAAETYVPSLYYPAPQLEADRLVPTADFPYQTCDLCYTPSLYYEAWQVAAVQATK